MSMGYAISVWGLSDDRIRQSLQQVMPTGRTIVIGQISDKGWLPYPNVTLKNVTISYPNSTQTQLSLQQLDVHLSWRSLLGQAHVQSMNLLQPKLNIARLKNEQWNIDDFYQPSSRTNVIEDISIVDGTLHVQETKHQYHLTGINMSVQNWQNTTSQLHLAFDWNPDWAGKQYVTLNGQLQKTSTGFSSQDIRIQLDHTLPKIGPVSWLATGKFEHHFMAHRSDFKDIQLKAQNTDNTFNAQFNVPHVYLQKFWQLSQANGVIQWQANAQNLTTATVKLNPTEFSSQHFKTEGSSLDMLIKQDNDTFSIKASGPVDIRSNGAFTFHNWHITSRQSDIQLVNDSLFRSEGLLNAFGNINDRWYLKWKGALDNDAAELTLQAHSPDKWELSVLAQQLDFNRYQSWLAKAEAQQPTVLASPKRLQMMNQHVQQGLQTWHRLPDNWALFGEVRVAHLRTEQMQLSNVQTQIKVNRDLLSLHDIEATAYGGQVVANLNFPRDPKKPSQWQMDISNMQIKPWLQHWRDYDRLSGTGNLKVNLQAATSNLNDIPNQLNGELSFDIKNGYFQGVTLERLLEDSGDANMQLKLDDQAQTEFDVFKSHSKIENGVFHTDTVDLNLPMGLRLQGAGKYQLASNKLDYQLRFGQHVLEQKLPIRITGPIQQPIIALDYQRLTQGLSNSTDKSNALRDALRKQWQMWQMPEFKQPTP